MATTTEPHFAQEMRGEGSPPRRNGELVFNEPWEGRAFGMAVALSEKGFYPWEVFRQRLIRAVADWERHHLVEAVHEHDTATCSHPEWNYYEQWLCAFEGLLLEQGLVTPQELDQRTEEFMTTRRDEAF
jgi:nitrile hydratase accessory protein